MRGLLLAIVLPIAIAAQEATDSQIALQEQRLRTGLDAFERRDYAAAASRLHAYFFDINSRDSDPWAAYALGVMHTQGLGTWQDTPLACAFLELAHMAYLRYPTSEAARKLEADAETALDRDCVGHRNDGRSGIGPLMSCFYEGPPTAQFDLGGGRFVAVDRLQVTLRSGDKEQITPLALNGCSAVILPVSQIRLGNRDFLHFFYWVSFGSNRGALSSHALRWKALEIRSVVVAPVADEELYRTADLSYPNAELTSEIRDLVKLDINAASEVEWTIATNPPRTRTIPPGY